MTQVDFFPVFAEWARKHGVGEASRRFGPILGDQLSSYVSEYEDRISRIERDDPPMLAGPRDPWYPGPNDEGDTFWPALKTYSEPGSAGQMVGSGRWTWPRARWSPTRLVPS